MANVIGQFEIAWPERVRVYIFKSSAVLDFDVDIINFGTWP